MDWSLPNELSWFVVITVYDKQNTFKKFGDMTKEMYREISKYFGINLLEQVISARRDKFLKRYWASGNYANWYMIH